MYNGEMAPTTVSFCDQPGFNGSPSSDSPVFQQQFDPPPGFDDRKPRCESQLQRKPQFQPQPNQQHQRQHRRRAPGTSLEPISTAQIQPSKPTTIRTCRFADQAMVVVATSVPPPSVTSSTGAEQNKKCFAVEHNFDLMACGGCAADGVDNLTTSTDDWNFQRQLPILKQSPQSLASMMIEKADLNEEKNGVDNDDDDADVSYSEKWTKILILVLNLVFGGLIVNAVAGVIASDIFSVHDHNKGLMPSHNSTQLANVEEFIENLEDH